MKIIPMQHKFKRVFHDYDTNIFNNIKLQTQNGSKLVHNLHLSSQLMSSNFSIRFQGDKRLRNHRSETDHWVFVVACVFFKRVAVVPQKRFGNASQRWYCGVTHKMKFEWKKCAPEPRRISSRVWGSDFGWSVLRFSFPRVFQMVWDRNPRQNATCLELSGIDS